MAAPFVGRRSDLTVLASKLDRGSWTSPPAGRSPTTRRWRGRA